MSSIPLMMAGIQVRPGADIEQMRRMLPDWDTEGQHLVKNYWLNVNWM
jgi:phage-related tail protein